MKHPTVAVSIRDLGVLLSGIEVACYDEERDRLNAQGKRLARRAFAAAKEARVTFPGFTWMERQAVE